MGERRKYYLEETTSTPTKADDKGQTPLLLAAGYGNVELVNMLLERGDITPDISDMDGETPLYRAALHECEDVVRILLRWDEVNPDNPNKCRQTALSLAVRNRDTHMIALLQPPAAATHTSD